MGLIGLKYYMFMGEMLIKKQPSMDKLTREHLVNIILLFYQ
jgi:hypothetical protein